MSVNNDCQCQDNNAYTTSFACCSSMTLEGESSGKSKERGLLLDQTVIVLPLNELRKRLNDIPADDYYPLLEFPQ